MKLTEPIYSLTTAEVAAIGQVKPHTIKEVLSHKGSYFGLMPRKLPNGRLVWPADSQARLFAFAQEKAAHKGGRGRRVAQSNLPNNEVSTKRPRPKIVQRAA